MPWHVDSGGERYKESSMGCWQNPKQVNQLIGVPNFSQLDYCKQPIKGNKCIESKRINNMGFED